MLHLLYSYTCRLLYEYPLFFVLCTVAQSPSPLPAMSEYDSDAEDFGPRLKTSRYTFYESAGAESMLKMLERATEDRKETKQRSKELELAKTSVKTERNIYLCWTRFCAFRSKTLKRYISQASHSM